MKVDRSHRKFSSKTKQIGLKNILKNVYYRSQYWLQYFQSHKYLVYLKFVLCLKKWTFWPRSTTFEKRREFQNALSPKQSIISTWDVSEHLHKEKCYSTVYKFWIWNGRHWLDDLMFCMRLRKHDVTLHFWL